MRLFAMKKTGKHKLNSKKGGKNNKKNQLQQPSTSNSPKKKPKRMAAEIGVEHMFAPNASFSAVLHGDGLGADDFESYGIRLNLLATF